MMSQCGIWVLLLKTTYVTRPALIVVRVKDRDHDLGVRLEGHVGPGDVVDGVVTEIDPRREKSSVKVLVSSSGAGTHKISLQGSSMGTMATL